MSQFGDVLRGLRGERKVGMKRLAHDLGVSHTYISHIERGKAHPSRSFVQRVAAHFEVDEEALLVASGRLPHDVEQMVSEHPQEVISVLRSHFDQASGKQK